MLTPVVLLALAAAPVRADPALALVEAGRREIREGLRGARPIWPLSALDGLPRVWGRPDIAPKSAAFRRELMLRYGLAFDPSFENDGLPVGFTKTKAPVLVKAGLEPGFTVSCQLCHTAALPGQISDGVGNVFMDYQRLHVDLHAAAGSPPGAFYARNPPRNSIVSSADYSGRLALFVRFPYPQIDLHRLYTVFVAADWEHREVPQMATLAQEWPLQPWVKTQPWVGYKYKPSGHNVDKGFTGGSADVHYALNFTTDERGRDFIAAKARFDQVGPAYLRSVDAPPYPWRDGLTKAAVKRGEALYEQHCGNCHGDFAEAKGGGYTLESFPEKLVDRKVVGTDTLRVDYGINVAPEIPGTFLEGTVVPTFKYVAPPLVRIWARAPYLHNGSVPTLWQLLNPKRRMSRFALQPSPSDPESFDQAQVGWKVEDLSALDAAQLEAFAKRDAYARIYDPTRERGLSNQGHTFGEDLTEEEQGALLDFLKAL